MVALYTEIEPTVYLVPKIALISAQYWWNTVSMLKDYFFERSVKFRDSMTPKDMTELVMALEDIRRTIESVGCPDLAMEARQQLLDAMSSTLLSLSSMISKNPEAASQHTASAREHLERFGMLLDEVGLN